MPAEMLRYIFSTLELTHKTLHNQAKFNRNVVIFAVATTAYAVHQTKKIKALETKIAEMSKKED